MWTQTTWNIYFFIRENILWECILFVACIVFLLILYLDLPQGGTDNLLITISQILATIFTLVFAITIFAAQMMGTFTAMDKMIDNPTKRYMAIFAFGIILPLIQLSTDKDLFDIDFTLGIFRITTEKLSLRVDLFIATFCVFALIPYSIKVNKIMKYEGGISKLYEKASEAIDSNHIETAVSNILELTDLGLNSLQDGQAYTINIIHKLTCIGKAVNEKRSERLAITVMLALGTLGVKAVHNETIIVQRLYAQFIKNSNFIGYVIPLIIYGLKDISINAIDWDISDNSIKSYSCNNLFDIGFKYDLIRFNKIVKPGKRHLFNLAGFIMGEDYHRNTNCIVYYLLEIANKSLSKKEYIFCWDSVSGQEDIEFRTVLKQDKDASDYSFDFINMEQVLEHVSDPHEIMRGLSKALKADGLLKVSVPNGHDVKSRLKMMDWKASKGSKRSLNAVAPLEHINCFNERSLILLAQRAGFEVASIPVGIRYAAMTNWEPIRRMCGNILMPVRDLFRSRTYLFFRLRRVDS